MCSLTIITLPYYHVYILTQTYTLTRTKLGSYQVQLTPPLSTQIYTGSQLAQDVETSFSPSIRPPYPTAVINI